MGLPRCRRQVFGPHKTFSKVKQIAKDLTSSFYEIDPRILLGDNSSKLLRFLTPAFIDGSRAVYLILLSECCMATSFS